MERGYHSEPVDFWTSRSVDYAACVLNVLFWLVVLLYRDHRRHRKAAGVVGRWKAKDGNDRVVEHLPAEEGEAPVGAGTTTTGSVIGKELERMEQSGGSSISHRKDSGSGVLASLFNYTGGRGGTSGARAVTKSGTGTTISHDTASGSGAPVNAVDESSLVRPVVLNILELTKLYSGGVKANDKVSFHVHQGEIFALLGHNGAGKTTLISQITGLLPATDGDALVYGYSIRDQMPLVRQNLSFCPQDNPLYDSFSLREHLVFFARLRGHRSKTEIRTMIDRYVKGLGLSDKLDTRCQDLSGGQKRRMWVACALFGSAPLMLLDEPTSGMDPQARREFWRMLKEVCAEHDRAALFTTHYLEEADLLADRKAILAAGRVVCCGTSQELKRQWGMGYWLNLSVARRLVSSSTPSGSGKAISRKRARRLLQAVGEDIIGPILFAPDAGATRDGTSPGTTEDEEVVEAPMTSRALMEKSLMYSRMRMGSKEGSLSRSGSRMLAASKSFPAEEPSPDVSPQARSPPGEASVLVERQQVAGPAEADLHDDTAAEQLLSRSWRGAIPKNPPPSTQKPSVAVGEHNSSPPSFTDVDNDTRPSASPSVVYDTNDPFADDEDPARGPDEQHSPPPQLQKSPSFLDRLKTKNPKRNDFFLSYAVPWSKTDRIAPILESIEERMDEFHLQDLSIEMTSMEEVFAAAGEFSELQTLTKEQIEEQIRHREADVAFSVAPLRGRNFSLQKQIYAVWQLRVHSEIGLLRRYVYAVVMLVVTWVCFATSSGDAAAMKLLFRKNFFGLIFIVPLYLFGGCLTTAQALLKERQLGIKQHLVMHGMTPLAYHCGNFFSYSLPALTIYLLAFLPLVLWVSPFADTSALPPVVLLLYFVVCCASVLQAMLLSLWFGPLFQTFFSIFSILVPFSWFCLNTIFDLRVRERKEWEFILYLRCDKPFSMQFAELILGLCFPPFALQNALVYVFRFYHSFEPVAIFPRIWKVYLGSHWDWSLCLSVLRNKVSSVLSKSVNCPGHDLRSQHPHPHLIRTSPFHNDSPRPQAFLDDPPLSNSQAEISGLSAEQFLEEVRGIRAGTTLPGREDALRRSFAREHPNLSQDNWIKASVALGFWDYLSGWPRSFWTDYPLAEWGGQNLRENAPKAVYTSNLYDWLAMEHLSNYVVVYLLPLLYLGMLFYHEVLWARLVRMGMLRRRGERSGSTTSSRAVATASKKGAGGPNAVHEIVGLASSDAEDPDVRREERRARPDPRDAVDIVNLKKRFLDVRGRPLWATNDVTLGVPKGECFGLLGPNGAGKTTLFELMAGNFEKVGAPSSGEVSVMGRGIVRPEGFRVARQLIGLAPQFDKIWPHVNARDHLRFYARMCGVYDEPTFEELAKREHEYHAAAAVVESGGVGAALNASKDSSKDFDVLLVNSKNSSLLPPPDFGESRVDRLLREVGLSPEDALRPSFAYSGGMKRKLSVALTLITDPDICFLDEMSAGVDVVAQRRLWDKLINRPFGQTIISTTHSMTEADATCDRVGILVGGRLQCLGETHAIKARYGQGYQLALQLAIGEDIRGAEESVVGGPGGASERGENHPPFLNVENIDRVVIRSLVRHYNGTTRRVKSPPLEERRIRLLEKQTFGAGRVFLTLGFGEQVDEDSTAVPHLQDGTHGSAEGAPELNDPSPVDESGRSGSGRTADLQVAEQVSDLEDVDLKWRHRSPDDEDPFQDDADRERLLGGGARSGGPSSASSSDVDSAERNVDPFADSRGQGAQTTTAPHNIRLAPIFRWCVEDPLHVIEDYALGEPTLEQVFLKFARRQELLDLTRDSRTGGNGFCSRCCSRCVGGQCRCFLQPSGGGWSGGKGDSRRPGSPARIEVEPAIVHFAASPRPGAGGTDPEMIGSPAFFGSSPAFSARSGETSAE